MKYYVAVNNDLILKVISKNQSQMYELIKCTDASNWNEVIKESQQFSIFSSSEFLESCGIIADRWILFKNKKKCMAALIVEPNNPSFVAPYPYSVYQGIYFIDKEDEIHSESKIKLDALVALLDFLGKIYKALSLSLHFSIKDIRAFQWFNYHDKMSNQYRIDISYTGIVDIVKHGGIDSYLNKIRKSRLQEFKKSISRNMTFIISSDIDTFIDLYIKTFQRQGIVIAADNLIKVRDIVGAALKYKYGNIFLCLDENKVAVSASVFIYDASYAYYLFGATEPKYRNSGASTYLMLNVFSYFNGIGIHKFDMVGVNSPQRGDYKMSYGAELLAYFNLTLVDNK